MPTSATLSSRTYVCVFTCLFLRSYAQCIPSRFKKDIVRAAKDKETEQVGIEGLEKVIVNIGASHKVSRHDMEVIFSEIGESGRISTEKMFKLL